MPGERLKTDESERIVPLAAGLIQEGFISYVESLAKGGALFPSITPSPDGRRADNGGKTLRMWIRHDLKLSDEALSPNHSWRHSVETKFLDKLVPDKIAWTITGRKVPGSGAGYRHPSITSLKTAVDGLEYAVD
jgi:hypothetical protein